MQQPAQDQAIKVMNRKRRRKFSKAMEPIHISMSGVTLREAEVVGWAARGLTNMEIAFQLQISSRTVQKHLERMFRKLGVRSRSELVARAYLALLQKGKGR